MNLFRSQSYKCRIPSPRIFLVCLLYGLFMIRVPVWASTQPQKRERAVLILCDKINENFLNHMIDAVAKKGELSCVLFVKTAKEKRHFERIRNQNPHHAFHLIKQVVVFKQSKIEILIREISYAEKRFEFRAVLDYEPCMSIEASLIANYLKLPNTGVSAAALGRNKICQRKILEGTPWNVPSQVIQAHELKDFQFPHSGVLKPARGGHKKDVIVWRNLASKEQILKKVAASTPRKAYLFEDFIEGQEFALEAFIQEGKVKFHSLAMKYTASFDDAESPMEVTHFAPCFYKQNFRIKTMLQLKKMAQYIIKRTKLENTAIHLEFKVTPNGIPKLISWTCCMAGDRVMNLYLWSGFDPYASFLNVRLDPLLRDKRYWKKSVQFKDHAAQFFYEIPQGYSFNKAAIRKKPFFSQEISNEDYEGILIQEEGHVIPELPEIKLHETGIIKLGNDCKKPVAGNDCRHYFVVVSASRKVILKDYKNIIERYIQRNFLKKLS